MPKDHAVLFDQVAVARAQARGLPRFVRERYLSLDNRSVLREREVDQNIAARCLENAGNGGWIKIVEACRDLWIAGEHRTAQVLRVAEVHQFRLVDLFMSFVDDHLGRWVF